jgi:hypothetical protein
MRLNALYLIGTFDNFSNPALSRCSCSAAGRSGAPSVGPPNSRRRSAGHAGHSGLSFRLLLGIERLCQARQI